MAVQKHTADWERIEAQYRTGGMSVSEIAREHGITEGAIRKRAKRDSWARDLSARVRARAETLVRNELVRNEVRASGETPTERVAIEVEAQVIARLDTKMRAGVVGAFDASQLAVDESAALFAHVEDLKRLGELMDDPDSDGKLNEIYRKVISVGSRTDTLKKALEAMKIAVGMGREVFNIGQTSGDDQISALKALFRESAQ